LTQFEFIFVLVSIILGLANLFSGISRRLQQPWSDIDGVHLAFSFSAVLSIFVVWWSMYRWQGHGEFEFGAFLIISLYTSVFYAMSVVLYPRDGALRTFAEVRTPFYVTVILYALLEVPYYEVGDFARPPFYWYAWISIGLYAVAIRLRRRALDAVLAACWLALWSGWWFVTKLSG
jgi:hypothetical protein